MDRQKGSSRALSLGSSLGRYSCVDITRATEDTAKNVFSGDDGKVQIVFYYIFQIFQYIPNALVSAWLLWWLAR